MDLTTAILPSLGRIEAKLDRLVNGAPAPTLDLRGAMVLTGDKSPRAFYRTLIEIGVQPVKRNKYIRADLESALSSRALRKAAELKRNRAASLATESVTEGRRHKIFPKQKPE